jgi:hypothetical protein
MARSEQRPEFWAAIVAEAQAGGQTLAQVVTKHCVTRLEYLTLGRAALYATILESRSSVQAFASPWPAVEP